MQDVINITSEGTISISINLVFINVVSYCLTITMPKRKCYFNDTLKKDFLSNLGNE